VFRIPVFGICWFVGSEKRSSDAWGCLEATLRECSVVCVCDTMGRVGRVAARGGVGDVLVNIPCRTLSRQFDGVGVLLDMVPKCGLSDNGSGGDRS
jgi:hypothetical protein